jgi:DNA polymerase III delta prime subunit
MRCAFTDTEETVQLKLNELSAGNGLTAILGLTRDKSHAEIVEQVRILVHLNADYKSQLDNLKREQEEEAEFLVNDAISKKLIKENYRQMHLKAFKDNFHKARIELAQMYPFQRVSLVDMLNTATKERLGKGKDNWTLEDYRKHAPQELQQNPKLFQDLLNKAYGTK